MRYHCATPALFDGKWILWALEIQVKVTGHKGFWETPSPRYGGHLAKARCAHQITRRRFEAERRRISFSRFSFDSGGRAQGGE